MAAYTPKMAFLSLPLEIRDQIYSHLLAAEGPITVLRGWTQCYGRYRGGLEPAILSVCRQTYLEAQRILYSSNTFLYLVRDAGNPVSEALHPEGYQSPAVIPVPASPIEEQSASGSRAAKRRKTTRKKKVAGPVRKVGDCQRVIYLAKYAHLLRHVEIELEANRTTDFYRKAMGHAIRLLGHGEGGLGARLVSLRFSLAPVAETVMRLNMAVTDYPVSRFFARTQETREDEAGVAIGSKRKQTEPAGDVITVIDALQTLHVRMIHFTVYTPSSRWLNMTLDMILDFTLDIKHDMTPDETADDTPEDMSDKMPNMALHMMANFDEPYGKLLATDELICEQRLRTATTSVKAFQNLQLLILVACTETNQAVESGWWTEYGPNGVGEARGTVEEFPIAKQKSDKDKSKWYTGLMGQVKGEGEYMRNSCPVYPMCVRGRLQWPWKRNEDSE